MKRLNQDSAYTFPNPHSIIWSSDSVKSYTGDGALENPRLEVGYRSSYMPVSWISTVTAILGTIGMLIYLAGYPYLLSLPIVLWLVAFTLPIYVQNRRNRSNSYILADDGIHFYLWNWFKSSQHFIPLSDVHSIVASEYSSEVGTLHIVTKGQVAFRTYDHAKGTMQMHPTIEMIPDLDDVKSVFIDAIRNYRKSLSSQVK